jgi:PAS domain S-box-containing protein
MSIPRPVSYILPLVLVILALLPRLLLYPYLDERSAFILFTLAVMASAWYGGWKLGLLATALSDILGGYFVLRPFETSDDDRVADVLEIALFTISGVGISWMAEQLHTARRRAEEEHQSVTEILESISDGFQSVDRDLRFEYVNSTAEQWLAKPNNALRGKSIFAEFPELFGGEIESRFRAVISSGEMTQFESYFEPWERWVELNVYPSLRGGLVIYFADITARKNAEREREGLITALQEALGQVKALSGLLPICSSCKKIRDKDGTWSQIETYIRRHSEADFSHGICPDCFDRLYPEFNSAA